MSEAVMRAGTEGMRGVMSKTGYYWWCITCSAKVTPDGPLSSSGSQTHIDRLANGDLVICGPVGWSDGKEASAPSQSRSGGNE